MKQSVLQKHGVRYGSKADPTVPVTPPANPPATPPAAPPANDPAKELTTDEVKSMIGETVTSVIQAQLPAALKNMVTLEGVKTAIEDAMKSAKTDSKAVTKDDIATIASTAANSVLANVKRDRKEIFSTAPDGRGQVEIPVSWCKGNLPLHGKQLFNLIAREANTKREDQPNKIKLIEITEQEMIAGVAIGTKHLDRFISKAKSIQHQLGMGVEGHKALTSTGGTAGDELVPMDLSSVLLQRFYLDTPLGAFFAAREIAMPTNPFVFPMATTRPKFYYGSTESTSTTESSPGTSSLTLTAAKFMGKTGVSYEVDEDSIIAVLPFCQEQLALGGAEAYEDAVINGDTAGTQDELDVAGTDISAVATHHTKTMNGLRKLALASAATKLSFNASDLVDEDNCRALRAKLKKWGLKSTDLVWVVGVSGKNKMDGISNIRTVDKAGTIATIVSGELTRFLNIPIITSAFMREDLTAAGINDNVTTTKGALMLVNAMGFMTGSRRQFTVETDRNIETQQMIIVASFRKAFAPIETLSATITPVGIGYNWTA